MNLHHFALAQDWRCCSDGAQSWRSAALGLCRCVCWRLVLAFRVTVPFHSIHGRGGRGEKGPGGGGEPREGGESPRRGGAQGGVGGDPAVGSLGLKGLRRPKVDQLVDFSNQLADQQLINFVDLGSQNWVPHPGES